MRIIFSILFLFLLVEVNSQPKNLYGLKTSKYVSMWDEITGKAKIIYIDETPVTYEDFKKYVRAGGGKTAYWNYESYNKNEQPVTGISWYHAIDYCNWRSKCEGLKPVYFKTDSLNKSGYPIFIRDSSANGYRLPTSYEFHEISGWPVYPWGDFFYYAKPFSDSAANIDIDSGMLTTKWWRLAPVKSQYKTYWGLYNVCGNNWHWCENDDWKTVNPTKILCGYGWGSIGLEFDYDSHCQPSNYNYDIGFRCVRDSEGVIDSLVIFDTTINYNFYKPFQPVLKNSITDFYSEEFMWELGRFIESNYSECINFKMEVDEQKIINGIEMAQIIVKVCKRNNINPLFLVSVMISESGFGTVSFPRWYNNPMAYMWQNKLMKNGLPTYENMPGKINRKYKTLEEGFEMFCKGIRRDLYFNAAKKNLDAFHLIYVGYRADEWMNTMTRIYRDIAGVRFEPKFPEGDAGKYIYADWEKIKK